MYFIIKKMIKRRIVNFCLFIVFLFIFWSLSNAIQEKLNSIKRTLSKELLTNFLDKSINKKKEKEIEIIKTKLDEKIKKENKLKIYLEEMNNNKIEILINEKMKILEEIYLYDENLENINQKLCKLNCNENNAKPQNIKEKYITYNELKQKLEEAEKEFELKKENKFSKIILGNFEINLAKDKFYNKLNEANNFILKNTSILNEEKNKKKSIKKRIIFIKNLINECERKNNDWLKIINDKKQIEEFIKFINKSRELFEILKEKI
ncbi:hypothetical protein Mgra_00000997 [Meloidogyne graminicola]|uniref:Uncharacterized protein n=1 Tax=Meloidogyne graminicola TaxID=189291 RepID=A0A8T0A0V7_9BILA|nr:hypothetical protein Mgra_00000997 [Meloidogyne graminicola]